MSLLVDDKTTQQQLQTLIEFEGDGLHSWTYAIFWQSSLDIQTGATLLKWGDGYYNGCDHPPSSADAAEQDRRKRVLFELNSLISGSDDAIEEEVTDPEWFFLLSMTQEFSNGSGLPGKAMFGGKPIWVVGGHRLASAPCKRAQQANMFGLQTIVFVPVGSGVVELGSTDAIMLSGSGIIDKIRVLFSFRSVDEVPPGSDAGAY